MGKAFGNLGCKLRGIIYYKLSPHEQKPFAGAISHGIPNLFRRFTSEVLYVAPPMIAAFLIYEGVESEFHRRSRKNPADYADEH